MGRVKRPRSTAARRTAPAGVPSWTLEEGRTRLHEVARRFSRLKKPSESLLDRAIDVGSHRKGGLLLVPEIDALAALERLEQAEREKEDLLEEIEDIGIVLLAQERLAEPTPADRLIPLEELARQLGRERLLAD